VLVSMCLLMSAEMATGFMDLADDEEGHGCEFEGEEACTCSMYVLTITRIIRFHDSVIHMTL
jgi:hypothetical protein